MLEKDIESKFRKKIKELGGRAYKFVSPGNAGVPDRIVVLPRGKIGFAELKRPGNTPRKLQEKQIGFLQKMGFLVKIIDSEKDIEDFIKDLKGE